MNNKDTQELVTALERTIVSLAAKLAIAEGQVEQLTTRLALLTDELAQEELAQEERPAPKFKIGQVVNIKENYYKLLRRTIASVGPFDGVWLYGIKGDHFYYSERNITLVEEAKQ